MALPISIPYTFANATTSIPLSQLDTDISTIYATVNGIGNGTVALANVVITGGIISNVSGISTSSIANGTSNVSIATANGSVVVSTAGNTAMTVDTSQNITTVGTVAMASSFKRNRIINGNMVIAQRATSAALPVNNSSTYTTVDRFCVFCGTGTAGTSSQVASGLTGFQYALKIQRTAGNTGTANIDIGQAVETANSIDLAGNSVTFSFYAKAGANFSASGSNIIIQLATGTGTDQSFSNMTGGLWTGQSNIINFVSQAITTSWARYTFTASVASTATQIGFQIIYTPTGTAGADDSLYFTGVQLEVGTKATPYEMQIYSDQLAQCQRYLPAYRSSGGTNESISTGVATSAGNGQITITFPVTTRVPVTGLVVSSAGHMTLNVNVAGVGTAAAFAVSGYSAATFNLTVGAGGMTTGYAGFLIFNNASGYLYFTGAEL
jgi:hypothetical protein